MINASIYQQLCFKLQLIALRVLQKYFMTIVIPIYSLVKKTLCNLSGRLLMGMIIFGLY